VLVAVVTAVALPPAVELRTISVVPLTAIM
jgi:hypothetical protein